MSDSTEGTRIVRQWVEKAEHDLSNAAHTLTLQDDCPFDTVCFHAQQCAEKYLKARLQEAQIDPPRIHHLPTLLELLLPVEPSWEGLRDDLAALSGYAVSYRYPGEEADKDMARKAVASHVPPAEPGA